jgi:diadenosine tetraphosphate (Ap4A) HIT family hydrolase
VGYVCVVARRHVVEPYQLPEREQRAFFAEVMATARAVAELVRPVRVNYELHGDSIPHLHLHLYPRHADDPLSVAPSTRATGRSPAATSSSRHCAT